MHQALPELVGCIHVGQVGIRLQTVDDCESISTLANQDDSFVDEKRFTFGVNDFRPCALVVTEVDHSVHALGCWLRCGCVHGMCVGLGDPKG